MQKAQFTYPRLEAFPRIEAYPRRYDAVPWAVLGRMESVKPAAL